MNLMGHHLGSTFTGTGVKQVGLITALDQTFGPCIAVIAGSRFYCGFYI